MSLGFLLVTSKQSLIFQAYLPIKLSTMLSHGATSWMVTNILHHFTYVQYGGKDKNGSYIRERVFSTFLAAILN
jgi:hypothetical protein